MYNVTITFNVNGQIISRNEKNIKLLSDSIDLIKARFNFSPEWQGYTKTAIFKSDMKRPYSRILIDDVCMVPPEAIKKSKYMSVSVFGVSGTQLITATDRIVPLTPSGYTDDSIVSPAPTENIYQQIVTLMQNQAVDAARAETAQGEAEEARDDAEGHAEQTALDRAATGADRAAVNAVLTGFAGTTVPNAIQAVEDKADTEIARVGQAGDTQVQAVNAAGAEQIGLATAQADRAEGEADRSKTEADKSEQSATIAANNILNGVSTHDSDIDAHQSIQSDIRTVEAALQQLGLEMPGKQATALTSTVEIAVADWNSGTTCTKSVTGVTAANIVIVDPSDANVECTAQGDEELTFSAPATPTEAVTVKVVILP